MNEPQLPFYACSDVAAMTRAIAFAQVNRAKPRWLTHVHADDAAWAAERARWQQDLDQLASELLEGYAAVAPKRGAQTCRVCDLALLCRVNHSARPDGADDDESGGDDDR